MRLTLPSFVEEVNWCEALSGICPPVGGFPGAPGGVLPSATPVLSLPGAIAYQGENLRQVSESFTMSNGPKYRIGGRIPALIEKLVVALVLALAGYAFFFAAVVVFNSV